MSYEKAGHEMNPPTYSTAGQQPMTQNYASTNYGIQPDVNYNNNASPPHNQAPYGAPASPPAQQPAGGYYGGGQPQHTDSIGMEHKGSVPHGAGGMPQYQQQNHGTPTHPAAAHTTGGPPNQGGSSQYKNLTPIGALTSAPAPVSCPACGGTTMTRTQAVTGNTTHAWAAGLCLTICLGCIPYCVTGTKDVEQKCGNCGVLLATWHRSGRTEVHMHS